MYISVRDCQLPPLFGSIKSGLDEMGLNAVEMEFFRDLSVCDIESTIGEKVLLTDEVRIEHYKRKLDELNIRTAALLMHNNFGADDLDAEIQWTISAVETAFSLGAKVIRIDAIMQPKEDWPLEKRVQVFADAMCRILDATADVDDIQLGIENHGIQGNQPEFLDMILSKVDSPRLGLTIDTANFYWYGHPLSKVHAIIEYFAPKVKHTHVKNINFPSDQREVQREVGWKYGEYASPLREGDIDIKHVITALQRTGYSGDLCIEDESMGRWNSIKQKAVLIDDANYLREII